MCTSARSVVDDLRNNLYTRHTKSENDGMKETIGVIKQGAII